MVAGADIGRHPGGPAASPGLYAVRAMPPGRERCVVRLVRVAGRSAGCLFRRVARRVPLAGCRRVEPRGCPGQRRGQMLVADGLPARPLPCRRPGVVVSPWSQSFHLPGASERPAAEQQCTDCRRLAIARAAGTGPALDVKDARTRGQGHSGDDRGQSWREPLLHASASHGASGSRRAHPSAAGG